MSALNRAAWTICRSEYGDYLKAEIADLGVVYADQHTADVELSLCDGTRCTASEAREFAARVVEGAAFAEGGPA
jgi:hypothetical protein